MHFLTSNLCNTGTASLAVSHRTDIKELVVTKADSCLASRRLSLRLNTLQGHQLTGCKGENKTLKHFTVHTAP